MYKPNCCVFESSDTYPVAILVKNTAFIEPEIRKYYVESLGDQYVDKSTLVAVALDYNDAGKAPVSLIKETVAKLLPALRSIGVEYLYCADADYFKILSGQRVAKGHLGYIFPCAIEDYQDMKVILGINHKSLMYNPANAESLALSIKTLADEVRGIDQTLGNNVVSHAVYPQKLKEIEVVLSSLLQFDTLTVDIEGFSLDFDKTCIATIGFSWDASSGVAFPCDCVPLVEPNGDTHLIQRINAPVRALLKRFFETYKGKLIFHKAGFDIGIIVYELWMSDLLDREGMLQGINIMCRDFDDTKLMAYLCLNCPAEIGLGLEELAHEYVGNYTENVKDITKIPLDRLLKYNLIDTCATFYIYRKYLSLLHIEQQFELYKNFYLPSQKTIIEVEMTGMPMSPTQVQVAKAELTTIANAAYSVMDNNPIIEHLEHELTKRAHTKDFADRKAKAKNPDQIREKDWDAFPLKEFNPGSDQQTAVLVNEIMGLPIIAKTPTGQSSVGGKVLIKLINHTTNPEFIRLLEALVDLAKVEIILSTFIPSFEKAISKGDNVVYLHGSFNLGGPVTGRLSSSDPNLQNIPAGSAYGKLIKSCFVAPTGWIFSGADFSSLEDRINALLTKDPEKLKVYTDGYDSHSLRAQAYFGKHMPDIILAKENQRCFEIEIDGTTHYLIEGTVITCPNGQQRPVEEYYGSR